jgi:hypothetical protein
MGGRPTSDQKCGPCRRRTLKRDHPFHIGPCEVDDFDLDSCFLRIRPRSACYCAWLNLLTTRPPLRCAATLTGCPATGRPSGLSRSGLPVGLQVVGPYLEDATSRGTVVDEPRLTIDLAVNNNWSRPRGTSRAAASERCVSNDQRRSDDGRPHNGTSSRRRSVAKGEIVVTATWVTTTIPAPVRAASPSPATPRSPTARRPRHRDESHERSPETRASRRVDTRPTVAKPHRASAVARRVKAPCASPSPIAGVAARPLLGVRVRAAYTSDPRPALRQAGIGTPTRTPHRGIAGRNRSVGRS